MAQTKSVFETLSTINVNSKVEKKSNLTYLSWAWAWAEVKKNFPDATYEVIRDPQTDKPWFHDPTLGYMTMTRVTIKKESLEMWLPVMDSSNKAMLDAPYKHTTRYGEKSVEKATMFDINKTLMRCLTKNLAMFGLGHYIYAGDDLPESAPVTIEMQNLTVGDENWVNILKYIAQNKSKGLEEISKMVATKYNITPTIKKALKKNVDKS